MTISPPPSKRGVALIVVMIAIFVLSILAGAFAYSMKVESKLALNSNNQADLEWIGRSGVEYARWILAQEKCPYDSLNQKWAGGPGSPCETNGPLAEVVSLADFHIGDGIFSLKITDLERKINVNTADEATLNQMLRVIGADANDSGSIVDGILDWVDRDDNTRVNGAESDYYQGLTPPYVAKNGPIDDISELLLIKGIRDNPEIYSRDYANVERFDRFGNPVPPHEYGAYLVDVLTPISTGRININTASSTVLQMIPGIDEAIATQIIRVRAGPDGADGTDDDTPFASVGELASVGLPQSASPQLNHYCTTRSSTFEVEVDAQMGSSKQTFYAIIGRNNPRDIQILSFYPK
ncbi:MAG TPA: general secretion pathway protein GspK [Verrucomicrobiae bacterium]|jgi:general secretion pathway protein K|nr:general secretion pathway protein GspK [Verrucomicrobiae bacterium]